LILKMLRKTTLFAALAISSLLFNACICHAQDMPVLKLKPVPAHIVVDGSVKEWGDSLSYYSPAERLNYAITNTKDTLYFAAKVFDRSEVARIMHAGITFIIDPKGKKRETFSITFPLNVGGGSEPLFEHNPGGDEDTVSKADREELMRERITTLRGIKVVGFKDVEDPNITTSNTYGFQTAIDFDDAGNLVCEAAIPMSFFHADGELKNAWAFDVRINGVQRPAPADGNNQQGGGGGGNGGMGGGRGGMGGGGGGRHGGGGGRHGGGGNNPGANGGEMAKTVDFWGKFYLVN
jgi:uncharacterized membrane protein YgcG